MKTETFPFHLGTHYSTSSYIFYYLMRNNPYCQNMIKLQNYKQENPNRMFFLSNIHKIYYYQAQIIEN